MRINRTGEQLEQHRLAYLHVPLQRSISPVLVRHYQRRYKLMRGMSVRL